MPTKLYKYRAFGVKTLRNLTEAEVFYAQPKTFNDPMDCDPTIDVDVGRETLEQLYYRLLQRRKEKSEAAREVNRLRHMSSEYGDFRTNKDVDAYLVQILASRIKDELDDEFGQSGVLSLSATWSSGLMWSHYADEHRGICIEYDTRDQDHPHLAPVSYRAPRAIKTSDLIRWKARDDEAAKRRVIQTYFYAKSRVPESANMAKLVITQRKIEYRSNVSSTGWKTGSLPAPYAFTKNREYVNLSGRPSRQSRCSAPSTSWQRRTSKSSITQGTALRK
ncbi:MAG TPA: DUF2971 domain-containing protein [Caulobacteraceae bacterium]|jgi:hypothetical protein